MLAEYVDCIRYFLTLFRVCKTLCTRGPKLSAVDYTRASDSTTTTPHATPAAAPRTHRRRARALGWSAPARALGRCRRRGGPAGTRGPVPRRRPRTGRTPAERPRRSSRWAPAQGADRDPPAPCSGPLGPAPLSPRAPGLRQTGWARAWPAPEARAGYR